MQKRERQGASSRYPFDYLSPESKKAKVEKLRKAVSSLGRKSSSGAKEIERMPVSEVQNEETSKLVYSVHKSEDGQRELQKILAEADESGEGCGQMVRDIWLMWSSSLKTRRTMVSANMHVCIYAKSANCCMYLLYNSHRASIQPLVISHHQIRYVSIACVAYPHLTDGYTLFL